MSDEKPPGGAPHTVPAGILDAYFGNKGPNGELMRNGKPVMLTDVPDTDDCEDDD
jgi:hypothetical protein